MSIVVWAHDFSVDGLVKYQDFQYDLEQNFRKDHLYFYFFFFHSMLMNTCDVNYN